MARIRRKRITGKIPAPEDTIRIRGGDCDSFIGSKYKGSLMPISGDSIAPFVVCHFLGSNFCVTVGNDSAPFANKSGICAGINGVQSSNKNHAVVSNFQYGFSGGSAHGSNGVTVEITDEEGSDFCNFLINVMPRDRDKKSPALNCNFLFQFGWISRECSGITKVEASGIRQAFPVKVDTAFQGGGVIRFTITCTDPGSSLASGVNTEMKVQGSDKDAKCLQDAIRDMFEKQYGMNVLFLTAMNPKGKQCPSTQRPPPACSFLVSGESQEGMFSEWEFDDPPGQCGGKNGGPKNKWPTNSKDPVVAALTWLQDYKTKHKKGFVVGSCNNFGNKPTIVFWESPIPDCKGISKMTNIGTFIVNGGWCSNVLEFKPQINWTVANVNQGGTVASATSGKSVSTAGSSTDKNEKTTTFKDISCDVSGQGSADRMTVPDQRTDNDPDNAVDKTAQAHAAQARALPTNQPISGDLVTQGNPNLDDVLSLGSGVFCGIVVINPFIISKKNKAGMNTWLAEPPINGFLTNSNWYIDGVSHQIKEGSFTTTIHVWLGTPGVTIDKNAPLGGQQQGQK